jgi:hypothetical protein
MSHEENRIKLDASDVPEFASLDDYVKNFRTSSPNQENEGRLVNYLTQAQLMQILSQRAIITKPNPKKDT